MSTFTNLYDNGTYGYMGIGPLPSRSIVMTLTAPTVAGSMYGLFCGNYSYWTLLAYDPADHTKYAVLNNTQLGTVYSPSSSQHMIVGSGGYAGVPDEVTVTVPVEDSSAWTFYGGLASVAGCALCLHHAGSTGSSPAGTDFVSIEQSKASWFAYTNVPETMVNTIDGKRIYAQRAVCDQNGNPISSIPASTSADATKVLTVDSSGNPGWAACGGVPSSTASDVDKVLTVNALGTPEWATAPAGAVVLTYGTSTWSQFWAAYNSGKAIVLKVNNANTTTGYLVTSISANALTNSVSFKFPENANTMKRYELNNNSVWNTYADTVTGTLPAYSSSDDGKFLGVYMDQGMYPAVGWMKPFFTDVSDIQKVSALPANPVSNVMYCIPET